MPLNKMPLKRRFHDDHRKTKETNWYPFIALQLIIQPIILIGFQKWYDESNRLTITGLEAPLTEKDLENWGDAYENLRKIFKELDKREEKEYQKWLEKYSETPEEEE
jgi:hypothetical protein